MTGLYRQFLVEGYFGKPGRPVVQVPRQQGRTLYMQAIQRLRDRAAANYDLAEKRAFLVAYACGITLQAWKAIDLPEKVAYPNAFGAGYNEGRGDAQAT